MSIQSTTYLSRKKAEQMLIDKLAVETIKEYVEKLSDKDIETQLESTFDNYMISSMKEECTDCSGTGLPDNPGPGDLECYLCDGTGKRNV